MRKTQLTITITLISSKFDNDKERAIHLKSDNIENMINDDADEVIEQLFKLLQTRYQNNFEDSMKGIEFVFDYVHFLY